MTTGLPAITPARLCATLALALIVAAAIVSQRIAGDQLLAGLVMPDPDVMTQVLIHYSWLTRLVAALIGGAALALAGVLMQQTLRNPLASPTTLGVAAGAHLALLLATLFAPVLLSWSRGGVAFAGGALATGLVFALAWRRGLSPTVLVLAGLVVNLYVGAVSVILLLFNAEALHGLMIWGAGSLVQNNWDGVFYLLPRLALCGVGAALLSRALALLDLDENNARSLGVSLTYLRVASLGIAVYLTACVVSLLGPIGFIGLAAPAIVRMAGARTLAARLIWAPVFGALLLACADQLLQVYTGASAVLIPTGAATAAMGAPLLLWLIPRLNLGRGGPPAAPASGIVLRAVRPIRLIRTLSLLVIVVAILALFVGKGASGWTWPVLDAWSQTGAWRLPRVLAAGGAGLMLALAGAIIQRISNNPMASPEVLGISAGTGIGLFAAVLLVPAAGGAIMLGAGTLGAMLTLAILVAINARTDFEPERLLLTGMSMMFLFDAVQRIVLAGGDPRTNALLSWTSGSTYYVSLPMAFFVLGMAALLWFAARPLARWLDLLPLGQATARALGVDVTRSRLVLLGLVALLTAGATLVVGPLSFVGLLAPHMARMMGLQRARFHLAGSAALGALLMITADWAGREIIFPAEIPAGLMATLIGGSYFMWRLRRL